MNVALVSRASDKCTESVGWKPLALLKKGIILGDRREYLAPYLQWFGIRVMVVLGNRVTTEKTAAALLGVYLGYTQFSLSFVLFSVSLLPFLCARM